MMMMMVYWGSGVASGGGGVSVSCALSQLAYDFMDIAHRLAAREREVPADGEMGD